MPKQPSTSPPSYLYGVSSALATILSNIVHPLEMIKTRFQSHDGKSNNLNIVPKYSNIFSAIRTITSDEGLLGIYKGFFVNTFCQCLSQALFFTIYQNRLIYLKSKDINHMTSVSRASFQASILASVITQPIWTIQTRMLLTTSKIKQKDNFKHNITNIYREYGLKGFFRGLPLSLMLSMNGFIQMYTFETCKILFNKLEKSESLIVEYLMKFKVFVSGGAGKIMSSFIMYPLLTVRTRYQQEQFISSSVSPKYKSIIDIIGKIISEQGLRGFYKGFFINLTKGFLQRGIYFYFYQLFKNAFGVGGDVSKQL